MRILFAFVAASLVTLSAAQTPPGQVPTPQPAPAVARGNAPTTTRTAIIRGRVTAADTGLPIRQAQVQVRVFGAATPPSVSVPVTATDDEGRFEFAGMPSGRVTVTASKSGYVTLSYGQRSPREPAVPVEIADGQSVERIDFVLPKGGSLVARITDDQGGPLYAVRVQLEEHRFNAAQAGRVLTSVSADATDDRGETFFGDVPPGDYYVSANPGFIRSNPVIAVSDSGRRYGAPTYYPGVVSAGEAQRVSVRAGQTATVAFPLVVVRAARVTGVVSTTQTPAQDLTLRWRQNLASATTGDNLTIMSGGAFEWLDVMPGQYTLSVLPRSIAGVGIPPSGEYASVPLTITGEDVLNLAIVTTPVATIRGHYVFDTGAPPPTLRPDAILPTLQGGLSPGRAAVKDDWTFELAAAAGPGVLRLRSSTPPSWFLKAVHFQGKEITDTATDLSGARDFKDLEVVLTEKRTDLSGSVTDSRGQPLPAFVVVMFPEDRSLRMSQSRFVAVGRPDQQGKFRILGLPPGRYLAAAVAYLQNGEERDAELLASLEPGAQRLTLAEGEARSLTLRVTN